MGMVLFEDRVDDFAEFREGTTDGRIREVSQEVNFAGIQLLLTRFWIGFSFVNKAQSTYTATEMPLTSPISMTCCFCRFSCRQTFKPLQA